MPGGNYIKIGRDSAKSTCVIFSPAAEEVGILARYLKIFEKYGINLLHIESRPSNRMPNNYQFMVECIPNENLNSAIGEIKDMSDYFNIISRDYKDNKGKHSEFSVIFANYHGQIFSKVPLSIRF